MLFARNREGHIRNRFIVDGANVWIGSRHADTARTIAWSTDTGTQFALEGNVAMTGSGVQWVGEFLGLKDPATDAAALAAGMPRLAGGSLFRSRAMVVIGRTIPGCGCAGHNRRTPPIASPRHTWRAQPLMQLRIRLPMCSSPCRTLQGSLFVNSMRMEALTNAALMQFQADILGRALVPLGR